jgi:glutamate/tyrosine decarboxylase-like PLP-dependent enzyme
MPSNHAGVDPYVNSVQWSRRFLGLRMFLSLAAAGWSGYGDHTERSVALADLLKDELAQRGWKTVNSSPLAVLCIKPPPGSGDIRSIVARVLASGRAWIAVASFEGSEVIRACVTHGETTPEDVLELVHTLIPADETETRSRRA